MRERTNAQVTEGNAGDYKPDGDHKHGGVQWWEPSIFSQSSKEALVKGQFTKMSFVISDTSVPFSDQLAVFGISTADSIYMFSSKEGERSIGHEKLVMDEGAS